MKQILNEWDNFLTERVSREERSNCKSPYMCKMNGLKAVNKIPDELLQAMVGKPITITLEQTPRSKTGAGTMIIDLGNNKKLKIFVDQTGDLKAIPGETIVANYKPAGNEDIPNYIVGKRGNFYADDFKNPGSSLKAFLSKFMSGKDKDTNIFTGKTYAIYYGVELSPEQRKQIAQNTYKKNVEQYKRLGYTMTKEPLPFIFPKGMYGYYIKNGLLEFDETPGGTDKIVKLFDPMVTFFVDNPQVKYRGRMSLEDINQFAAGKKTRLAIGDGKTVGVYPFMALHLNAKFKPILDELNFWQKRGFIRRAVLPAEIDNGTYKANYKDGILYAPTRYGGLLIRWYDPPKVTNGFCKLVIKDGKAAVIGWGAQSEKFNEVNNFQKDLRGWIGFKSKVKAPAFPT
jgi:hypothetical protein